jgi:CPA1 family monovalent cation:H+ antiporter
LPPVSDTVDIFLGLLVAVATLGWLAKRIRIAYPILLVLGGLAIGLIPGLPRVRVSPEFIFLFILPPLLFPAALFTPWRDFRANLRPILLLAIGLVLFTTVLTGWLAHYYLGLPLAVGLVLGAIISPPDAVAATAITDRLSIPRRIVTILEGESLVNDASALVAYRFGVVAVATGTFSVWRAGGEFLWVGIGGILVGILVGWLAAWFHTHVDDAPVEVTVSLLTPFVAYVFAERLGVSGVLSVVAAGLLLGWRTPEITTSRTRLQAGPFWSMIEFLLNGVVFILIGLELPEAVRALSGRPWTQLVGSALWISLAVVLTRIVWVFPATYLPRLMFKSIRARDPIPDWRQVTIVAWTGMRGVVSMAAALALPITGPNKFPQRDMILFLTFSVILATLVVQGLTLPFLIKWLGIESDDSLAKEEREARLKANQAALTRLNEIPETDPERREARDRLRIEYEDRIRQLEAFNPAAHNVHPGLFSSEYEKLSSETLRVEREIILRLRNRSIINDQVLRRIQRDIDLAEARLRRRE